MKGGRKILSVISELNKVAPLPYPIWHLHRQARRLFRGSRMCWHNLTRIVIILLLYADDIILLARCPSDLDKQLRLLKDFCSTMGMIVNTDKTKIMIIKSKKDTYANFMYDKYLGIDIHHKLN